MLKKNINTPHSDSVNPLMGSLWKGKKMEKSVLKFLCSNQ